MDIKSCIFDMDGTLLNTLGDITVAVNITLKNFGFPEITEEQCKSFIGSGSKTLLMRAIGIDISETEFKEIYSDYMLNYRDNLIGKTVVYDGVYSLISSLSKANIKLSVCSNKPDDCAKKLVRHFFDENLFIAVYGQLENIPVKPNPYFPLKIIDKSGIPRENTVMIGDSAQDVLTGNNTGIKTLSVLWGYQDRENIENAGGNLFFNSPAELEKYIFIGK